MINNEFDCKIQYMQHCVIGILCCSVYNYNFFLSRLKFQAKINHGWLKDHKKISLVSIDKYTGISLTITFFFLSQIVQYSIEFSWLENSNFFFFYFDYLFHVDIPNSDCPMQLNLSNFNNHELFVSTLKDLFYLML